MRNPFRYFNNSPEVICLTVMLYFRYPLSFRQVEDVLFERGIEICHETVRLRWNRFGPMFAATVDHEGEVPEVFATKRRDRRALEFLKRAMKCCAWPGTTPQRVSCTSWRVLTQVKPRTFGLCQLCPVAMGAVAATRSEP